MMPSPPKATVKGAPYSRMPSHDSVAEIVPRSTTAVAAGRDIAGADSVDASAAHIQAATPPATRTAASAGQTSLRYRRRGASACDSGSATGGAVHASSALTG